MLVHYDIAPEITSNENKFPYTDTPERNKNVLDIIVEDRSWLTMTENSNAIIVEPFETLTTDEVLVATNARRKESQRKRHQNCGFTSPKMKEVIDILVNIAGETIGKIIEACLLDWGIDRVFTITIDNASANDVAIIKYVKKELSNWVADGIILEGEFFHVRCCAHILNLIVTEGLKDIHESIISIRNVMRYVRSSPSRLHKFKKCVEHEKIV
ncbi:hypothetical protein Ddye_008202 [Dipteronia dyeriana]|uniref:Uncharacterized protein n=1 Tax=Dipteronia dyeriana TaxID=168575 RepID=A0AAE0CL34_9ROSI|nr:hypothetical protein Ddye_008202 [Dipteronia dyeriana]